MPGLWLRMGAETLERDMAQTVAQSAARGEHPEAFGVAPTRRGDTISLPACSAGKSVAQEGRQGRASTTGSPTAHRGAARRAALPLDWQRIGVGSHADDRTDGSQRREPGRALDPGVDAHGTG